MKRYRVNFFWDEHGCSVTLWIRYCTLPEGFGPLNVAHDGLWVREKPIEAHVFRGDPRLYVPHRDIEMLFDRLDGTAWIPPGRITSVTEEMRFREEQP